MAIKAKKPIDLSFGANPVDDKTYKADLEALDRYLKFTEEILRLSLVAIGAEVAYLKLVYKLDGKASDIEYKWFFLASLISFTFAAVCSLFHRFQSTDGFTSHVEYLRAYAAKNLSKMEKEAKNRNHQYDIGGRALVWSCWFLGLGIVFFIIAVCLHFF